MDGLYFATYIPLSTERNAEAFNTLNRTNLGSLFSASWQRFAWAAAIKQRF